MNKQPTKPKPIKIVRCDGCYQNFILSQMHACGLAGARGVLHLCDECFYEARLG